MQRITWDLRYPGPWTAQTARTAAPAARWCRPGNTASASPSGGQTITRTFDLSRIRASAADGVTDGGIAEQVKFQLQVRDAISDARKLQQSIEQAMQKAGLKPQLAPGAARQLAEQHQVRPPAAGALRARSSTRPASTRRAC